MCKWSSLLTDSGCTPYDVSNDVSSTILKISNDISGMVVRLTSCLILGAYCQKLVIYVA